MSKPDKPGELRDVTVKAISLVSKAANGQRFKIFKSAEEERPAPEVVEKDERGLFHILKKFFTGAEVEKGEVADLTNAKNKGMRLNTAMESLMTVLGLNRWGYPETNINAEKDPAKIRDAINDFKAVAEEILLGSDSEIMKTVAEIDKSGRKISGSRLSQLKNIQAMLSEVLSGLEDPEDSKEGEELTKEEILKAVDEAIKPVSEQINKAVERIEKIENARGVSNKVPEDSAVEKGSNDFWEGVF